MYRFIYQANDPFEFDHLVTVKVNAADLAGNAMSDYAYSFTTEMQIFGDNRAVSAAGGMTPDAKPATVSDADGNVWVVWQAGQEGQRRIYASLLAAGTDSFTTPVRVATNESDQCHADIARGSDGRLYAVWQDNQRGNWDIFSSISTDGIRWSRPVKVSDSDKNAVNPAIAVDHRSPCHVYVVWEDDRNGNADIYLADSSNGFAQRTISRVTGDGAAHHEPDVAVNGANVAVVVWTDTRNGQADIYGASSSSPAWTNVPLVAKAGIQASPALAADPTGTKMHLLWTDQASGNSDVFYASFDGLPSEPLTGVTVADDTSGADQTAPAIVCTKDSKVFACWQDFRHVRQQSGDTDLFVTDLTSGTPKTNVLVGDGATNSGQSEPALGADPHGNVYVVWTDNRSAQAQIYYAATTAVDPTPLNSKLVDAAGATVGTDPSAIHSPDDVSIVVPPQACPSDIRITISKIINPKAGPVENLGSYDFGPSGIDFDQPVTVTVPYRVSKDSGSARPYWYDSLTGVFSQQGITDIQDIVVSPTLHAMRFKTTHFTPYYIMPAQIIVAADTASTGGSGCSLSVSGNGSPNEMIIPFAIVALTMLILRRRDLKRRRFLAGAAEQSDETRM